MAKKEANLTAIMLVQQLEEEYWLSNDYKSVIQKAKDGNCRPLLEMIIQKLEEHDIIAKEAYIIKHDKDKVTIWNPDKMKNEINDKEEHVHALLKFEKGASLKKIALAIGVEPQYLEKLKSGRYGYDNCLAYLVHAKDESKYQYHPEEVITLLGEDYTSLYHRNMKTWVKGRATKKAKETNLSIDWLIEKILAGEVTKSNIMLTDDYYTIYGQHKRKINEALDTAGERKSFQAIEDIDSGKFKKTIIFLQGESGQGKTKLSKSIINIAQRIAFNNGYPWDSCSTASTNAFDEYNGQDVLFLDDMRGDSLTVSDWLKLLDPYTISPISARYHNKMGAAKLIIITSTKAPLEFFSLAKGNFGEDLGQFVRRIDLLAEVGDNIKLSKSVKLESMTSPFSIPLSTLSSHSFNFQNFEVFNRNMAIDYIIKTIIRNMQWNKKERITHTDQSTKDTLTQPK
ncbi:AAA family ATPase [Streptococcus sp. NSJ-72]|uniref:Rep family protein n=1 Tax=Streptococcus sp. NSJ-72 TaxID=2763068 RepID=UPI0016518D0B|nr:Rep family protein [Streptococcus sp. NSJ-72]QNL42694.1 AAA family ATPase [Streptococcus sp. NSJ-72]